MRSRLLIFAVGFVVGGLATGFGLFFLGDDTDLSVRSGSHSSFISKPVSGESYAFVAARICMEGPGPVTVTGARSSYVFSDVEVVDFAVAPAQAIGQWRQQDIETYVSEVDAPATGPATKKLVTHCSEQYDSRDLVVELKAPDALPAVVLGFDVTYRIGNTQHTIRTEDSLVFCSGTKDDELLGDLADGTVADCQA